MLIANATAKWKESLNRYFQKYQAILLLPQPFIETTTSFTE